MVTSDFRPEVELWLFCACAVKNKQYNPYLWPNRRNFHVVNANGVEKLDGDIRFYIGMEICPFRARAMKNVPYNPYLRPNRRNSRVLREIGVEEDDIDVRF